MDDAATLKNVEEEVQPFQINGKDAKDVTLEEFQDWCAFESKKDRSLLFLNAHSKTLLSLFPQIQSVLDEFVVSEDKAKVLQEKVAPLFDLHFFMPMLVWVNLSSRYSTAGTSRDLVIDALKTVHPILAPKLLALTSRTELTVERATQPAP